MGIKRVVNTDFWKDDIVAEQYSAEDRYFMLYLLSNPSTKQCGIYHLPIRTISFEMGYSNDSVRAILERFVNRFSNIIYNYDTQEIAILNFLKHSIIKGGKPVEDCIRKELGQIKDTSLIPRVYKHIKPYIDKQTSINNKSMYIGIEKVFLEFINDNDINNENDNDNDNERIVPRIVSGKSKEPVIYIPNDEKLNNAFLEFIEFRKKIKATMTDRAIQLMIKKLDSMTNNNDEKIEILNQSIMNGWKGVFPLNKNNANSSNFYDDMKEWAEQHDSTGICND